MPSTHTDTDPQGNKIIFEEDGHRYYTRIPSLSERTAEVEITYTSTTALIKQYAQPFDPDGTVTAAYAAKHGKTVDEVKAEWAAKSAQSCDVGTRVHEVCEDVLLGRDLRNSPRDEHEQKLMYQAYEIANSVRENLRILGVEKIVFDINLAVAGTIDFLGIDADGVVHVCDWKTNSCIERENKYNKFMQGGLSHLADTTFNHYALQLSLYHNILRNRGYIRPETTIARDIFHIREDGVEHIEVPYYGEEAARMLYDQAVGIITETPF